MKKIIGIDLGGTSAKLAIISQDGELLKKWSITTNNLDNGRHIVPDIITSIKEYLELYHLTPTDFVGIGMGSPGKVDEYTFPQIRRNCQIVLAELGNDAGVIGAAQLVKLSLK